MTELKRYEARYIGMDGETERVAFLRAEDEHDALCQLIALGLGEPTNILEMEE